MCAELNSIRPAGEKYKLQVPSAETLERVAVANPARQTATVDVKPGGAIVQAVMRERERSRAPLNVMVRDGRAYMNCAQGNTRHSHTPVGMLASQGSKTTACTKGPIRELGKSIEESKRNFKVGKQGVMTELKTILPREIRCLHSSWEVQ